MSQLERIYRIEQMLLNAPLVSFEEMLAALEVSPATLKRDLSYLRDRLHAPIVYDRFKGGYLLAEDPKRGRHRLPGLWFSPKEIQALLTMHHLLQDLETGGLLGPHIQPLLQRVQSLMDTGARDAVQVEQRVRLIPAGLRRQTDLQTFEMVGNALMMRKRLDLTYEGRHRREVTQRQVSPQRLVHYRDNWYLEAWCHASDGMRKFALDAIRQAVMSEETAQEIPLPDIEQQMSEGYGVYAGGVVRVARLRFNADAARWVRHEIWHAKQKQTLNHDGSLDLELPYVNDTELVMDVLRHGENVEVLAPPELRETVARRLKASSTLYD